MILPTLDMVYESSVFPGQFTGYVGPFSFHGTRIHFMTLRHESAPICNLFIAGDLVGSVTVGEN